ncbi:high mobility group B protein 7-like [Miscanthus floridulus]|uniref:high mobility group B protein 7-like n=1 Tax=Miscanthus floridulus TaxID=154761 RepID=UPI0034584962
MDHSALLPRDLSVRVANRTEGERLRKAKEDKRKKRQQKLRAWERGEDTDSDDDDDEEDDDEVVDDIEWDVLKSEDVLTDLEENQTDDDREYREEYEDDYTKGLAW